MKKRSNFYFLVLVLVIFLGIILVMFYRGLTGFVVSGAEVSRSFSIGNYRVDEGFDVSIQLTDSGLQSGAIGVQETAPEGWEVTRASDKGVIRGNKIEWLLVPPKFETLTYSVIPKTQTGEFNGVWMTEDLEENRILGKTEITMETTPTPKPAVCTNANVLLAKMDDYVGTTAEAKSFIDGSGTGKILACAAGSCPEGIAAGKVGGSMRFDGTNDYLNSSGVASAINGNQGTFALWARFNLGTLNDSLAHVIIGLGNSAGDKNYIDLRKVVSNDFVFRYMRVGNAFEVKRAGMTGAETWHYYAAVWTATEIKFYIDGVLIGTTTNSAGSVGNLGQFRIGTRGFQAPYTFFKGQIDEVYIWNRALTESEVQELYNQCFA